MVSLDQVWWCGLSLTDYTDLHRKGHRAKGVAHGVNESFLDTEALQQNRHTRKAGLSSVCFPIQTMYLEHKKEKLRFELLHHLMDQNRCPKNCSSYTATCKKLDTLSNLWQDQVQLEDNILFPKLLEMEAKLGSQDL